MSIIVPPYGPSPNPFLLIGEAPGREEAAKLRPFAGKSGSEQRWYLSRHSINPDSFRQCNIIWEYLEGNPDPTPDLIRKWTPTLLKEIHTCNPRLIIAVGRFAARFFLGEDIDMESCHGIPHYSGAFDKSRESRAPKGCIILPILHPALGFYDNDARSLIAWDYSQVAECVRKIKSNRPISVRSDGWQGQEQYRDVTGRELAEGLEDFALLTGSHYQIGLDTEGTPSNPWSIQVAIAPAISFCLRYSQPDFILGIQALQRAADNGTLIVMHNALYDLSMCRAMGLDLYHPDIHIWDTMYAAYILRLEPQGLKPLLWRWCGMRQSSYPETVGDAGRTLQLDYLSRAYSLSQDWPNPSPQQVEEHDGTTRTYKPQPIQTRISKILTDVADNKTDKDGNPVDILDRWDQIDKYLRKPVEDSLGPIPVGTLDDIPLDKAIRYSCRDSDGTLRLYHQLHSQLASRGLLPLMSTGMQVLPVFSEMQFNGMPASRSHFLKLHSDMLNDMRKYQRRLSKLYYGGKPFNPGSSKQVASLLRRRGLKSEKRTESGEMSTSKGSIEHLRYTDSAVSDVFDWRERQKVKDSFCEPVLEEIPDTCLDDIYFVHYPFKTTRTATRRLASFLLTIPVRTELGLRVRKCFIAPPGYLFGSGDLSNAEMRVMADESADPLMCQLFHEGRDIHYETASRIFGIPLRKSPDPKERYMDIDKMKHRYPAKTAGFGCVPLNSKALGRNGWLAHNEVKIGDEVLGYNQEKDQLEWTKVLDKVLYPSAPIVRMYNSNWSIISTPNHRWYGHQRKKIDGIRDYHSTILRTDTVNGDSKITISAPLWDQTTFINITDNEACLLGWILGDGSIKEAEYVGAPSQARGAKVALYVDIYQSKKEGIEALRIILKDIPHYERVRKCGKMYTFSLIPSYSRDLFSRAGVRNIRDSNLEKFVLNLSFSQRIMFLEGVYGAEGYVDAKGCRHIGQNDGPFLEAIRLAIFLTGHSPSKTINDYRGNYVNFDVRYRKPYMTGQRIKKEKLGNCPVWCIKTELGSWVMKQGDEITITGNTLYGIQGQGLETQLRQLGLMEWNAKSCDDLIREWLGVYKGVADYIYRVYQETLSSLESCDRWGMPRYLPGIANKDYPSVRVPWHKNLKLSPTVAEAVRHAVSQRIQGGARGMVINAYTYLRPIIYQMQVEGLKVQWALDVHDEIVLLFEESLQQPIGDLVTYALTEECGTKLKVPIVSDWCCGKSWGDLKD